MLNSGTVVWEFSVKCLIVWAHPEEQSFNGALVEAARRALEAQGHEVRVTDLYRSGFNAVASVIDFNARENPGRLVYDAEQAAAAARGDLAPDIQAALDDVIWCDLLILQFPLWWFSVPAIMKGWIDRVMVKGIAYGGGRWYDRGGFAGRRALLSITTAAYPQMCGPEGINGSIDVILWPLHQGILRFVGFEALSPNIIWSATYVDDAERRTAMEHYVERLRRVATEIPEAAHGRSEFGKDWRLLPEVSPRTVAHWRGQ